MRTVLFNKIICLMKGIRPQRVHDMFCTKHILYSSYKITSSKITEEFALNIFLFQRCVFKTLLIKFSSEVVDFDLKSPIFFK